jgi:glycosyltransferase involved in cell wall biosynthesis
MNQPDSPSKTVGPDAASGKRRNDQGPVILFGNVPYASARQRAQQFARCWSQSHDVVYVDPNRSFLQGLRKSRFLSGDAEAGSPRLHHYQPPAGLPFARTMRLFNRFNYARTLAGLYRFLEQSGFLPPHVVILSYPDQVDVCEAFPGSPIVYDLMDEPTLFLKPWQKSAFHRMHLRLVERCDLLVTSSRVLHERYAGRARKAVCVTNGVRRELIDELSQGKVAVDPRVSALRRPVLGYLGMISHWFDFAMVKSLASAFPHGSVALVGPMDVEAPALPDNVKFLGPVPHRDLASVLAGFDLGLIPFRRCPAIDAVNPIKLYEYLAAGLPVLASAFDEMNDFGQFATTYDNRQEGIALANALLIHASSSAGGDLRRAFARNHCWDTKARQFLDALPPAAKAASKAA